MAVVYAAWDERLRVRRAIKVLLPEMAGKPEVRRRFEREARIQARLEHPRILTVHDVCTDGDKVFLVLELLQGGNLAELVAREGGRLTVPRALNFVEQLLEALHFAHGHGVIHRDIKPQNVLLAGGEQVKVADFGIARCDESSDHHLTHTGAVMGTWAFMPPEQRENAAFVGTATDIYAVGCTLYCLVVGRIPFGLYATDSEEEYFSDLDPALAALIRRATRFDPAARFPTAAAMAKAVREVRLRLMEAGAAALPPLNLDAVDGAPVILPTPARISSEKIPPAPPVEKSGSTFSFSSEPVAQPQQASLPSTLVWPGEEAPSNAISGTPPLATAVPPEPTVLPSEPRRSLPVGRVVLGAALVAALALGLWAAWVQWGTPAEESSVPLPSEPPPAEPIEPAPGVPVPEPLVEPAKENTELPSAVPPVAPSARVRSRSPVQVEPAAQGAPATDAAEVPLPISEEPAPALAPVLVSVQILSDPIGASVSIAGRRVTTQGTVEVPVGRHRIVLSAADWQAECEQDIDPGVRKVKFVRGSEGCVIVR